MKPVTEVLYSCYELFGLPGTWVQGSERRDGSCCALVAMNYATDSKPLGYSAELIVAARNYFAMAIGKEFPDIIRWNIIRWNDRRGRTQEEVRDAFLRAAQLSEES